MWNDFAVCPSNTRNGFRCEGLVAPKGTWKTLIFPSSHPVANKDLWKELAVAQSKIKQKTVNSGSLL